LPVYSAPMMGNERSRDGSRVPGRIDCKKDT
jgi:hypothetical protein